MLVGKKTISLFVLPLMTFVLFVVIYPMITLFWFGFSDVTLMRPFIRPFVGFENFKSFFSDGVALYSIRYTFMYIFTAVGLQLLIGMIFALLMDSKVAKSMSWLTPIFTIPLAIASVAAALFWRIILHNQLGVVNYALSSIGFPEIMWWGNLSLTPFTLILIDTWQWMPFMFLIILAGLKSISQSVLEAAEVDGASGWKMFLHIKLPLLKQYILVAAVLRIALAQKKVFDIISATTGGGPGRVTETLNYYIYRVIFMKFHLGYAAALSVILLIIMIAVAQPFVRKIWKEKKREEKRRYEGRKY